MRERQSQWALFSNHGHVLVCIANDLNARLRDISAIVGITERAVHSIIEDLEYVGILERIRVGRRNQYVVDLDKELTHPLLVGVTVGRLISWLHDPENGRPLGIGARA